MLVFIGEDCLLRLISMRRGLNACSCVGKLTDPHRRWPWLTVTCSPVRTSNFANKCQYRPCKFPCFYSRLQLQWPFKATVPSVSCSYFSFFQLAPRQSPGFCVSTSFPFSKLNRTVGVHCVRHTLPTQRFALYQSEIPVLPTGTDRDRP